MLEVVQAQTHITNGGSACVADGCQVDVEATESYTRNFQEHLTS